MGWVRDPSLAVCAEECGAKCCKAPGHVFLTTDEMRRLKAFNPAVRVLNAERGRWVMDFRSADCVFLAGNRCTIYGERPAACQRFPMRPFADCLVWPAVA